MDWKDVGTWIKNNAGPGAALIGSLMSGNIPGAVAAGAALVQSATGEADPSKAMAALQTDPGTVVKLRELAVQEGESIRQWQQKTLEATLLDQQAAHKEQQDTIREGDNASDEYVRHTRPMMARQSWWGTAAYVAVMELAKAYNHGSGASIDVALILLAPAGAYLGFRTADKIWSRGK